MMSGFKKTISYKNRHKQVVPQAIPHSVHPPPEFQSVHFGPPLASRWKCTIQRWRWRNLRREGSVGGVNTAVFSHSHLCVQPRPPRTQKKIKRDYCHLHLGTCCADTMATQHSAAKIPSMMILLQLERIVCPNVRGGMCCWLKPCFRHIRASHPKKGRRLMKEEDGRDSHRAPPRCLCAGACAEVSIENPGHLYQRGCIERRKDGRKEASKEGRTDEGKMQERKGK
jgi:hypothetical protein